MEHIKGHGVVDSLSRKKTEITWAPVRPTRTNTLNNSKMRSTFLMTAGTALLLCLGSASESRAQTLESNEAAQSDIRAKPLAIDLFLQVARNDEAKALAALTRIEQNWHESSFAPLIEMIQRVPGRTALVRLIRLVEAKSGQPFTGDLNAWFEWLWSVERPVHPDYAAFKAALYEGIDPRFREYFDKRPAAVIRLDEIRWGGVRRDGIPPLKNPKMIVAKEAGWLEDDHVVFGVAINGDARAYPKRILAWHEMFKDRIGGRELAGVYCTLCGALVLYDVTDAKTGRVQYELGTSGFLYRSNKLMYDHATKSMWTTLTGTPVVGPLVGKGIELKSLFVVTTTWKEWRTRHPATQVLSLDTGHNRDYGEGVAYGDYFASDQLMFTVPKTDARLPNKAEVLALRAAPASPGEAAATLAIAADFLAARPVYAAKLGKRNLVVLTDTSGANRVYEAAGVSFTGWDQKAAVRDSTGAAWRVDEDKLTGPNGDTLPRVAAHRAFWFGWHAAFPDTQLIR